MGRKSEPLFERGGIKYARYYDQGKRVLLSLGTGDKDLAMQRYPIVRSSGLSWQEYQKSLSGWRQAGEMTVPMIGTSDALVKLAPAQKITTDKTAMIRLLETASAKEGSTRYNKKTGEWAIGIEGDGDLISQLTAVRQIVSTTVTDQSNEIESFYNSAVPQIFDDKKSAIRSARIWLQFLALRKVISWEQITDTLLQDFKLWRETTPVVTDEHPARKAKPPGSLVVSRHMQYLKRSFDLAVIRGYMRYNLLALTKPDPYLSPEQDFLSIDELKKVLADPAWQQNWLTRGVTRVPLGYRHLDILLLLFCGCKRRSEVCELRIENINYQWHFAYYLEEKNRSKSGVGSIGKAFWLTAGMEDLLRRVIGDRKMGYVFVSPWDSDDCINADLISEKFDETVKKHIPEKHLTLKNLRQTAYEIMENSKQISVPEIDLVLGHYTVKTALGFYQDRSIESRGKRLSEQNKKGVEILYKAVKEFFVE